jgi:hypothetical protein
MSELDELLSRLPSKAEAQQSWIFEGRALSRDNDHLHLATSSGVIAIPLTEIEAVKVVTGQSNDIVSVNVRQWDKIKYIRHASPISRISRGGGGGPGNSSDTYSGGGYIDSVTASGGSADATDDTFWIEVADDVWT